jgi:hypothetical protein
VFLLAMDGPQNQGKQKKKTLQPSPPQTVLQEGQHPSPQSLESQAQIPGLNTKGISPELLLSILNILLLLYLVVFFPCIINFKIKLLSYPYSYSLHFPFFSFATVHRYPS